MNVLFKNINSLVTVNAKGKGFKTGAEMNEIGEIKNGAILFDERIEWIGTTEEAEAKISSGEIKYNREFDLKGKTVMPGFVDSHTHIVFAGDRSNEFVRRLKGATYKEIAEEGGGILATMKATREASVEELVQRGLKLAYSAIDHGTSSIEIKSGYGLSTEAELNQLRAVKQLKKLLPMHISATFMGAHDFPPEYKDNRRAYIDIIKNEMIPAVIDEGLAEFCDAFIDEGYYTLEEGEEILQAGLDAGLKLKVHCDELASFGAAELAARMGAVSADHLLYVSDGGIQSMKNSGTVASLLPGTAYFIRLPYAPARKIIEEGVITALATDCNPGSCFTENMQHIMHLAAINMRMSMEECICAATINGAKALGIEKSKGSLEPGKDADFIVLAENSYSDMFYHFGINHVEETWIRGRKTEVK